MSQPFANESAPAYESACAMRDGSPCVVERMGLMPDLSAVDMAQALEDFDGDHASVSGLLRDFLGDRSRCAARLDGLEGGPTQHFLAVLHDVANTLDAGWCRQAALAVRSREEHLRRGTASAAAELAAEVRAVVNQAFEGVAAVVRHCPQCLAQHTT